MFLTGDSEVLFKNGDSEALFKTGESEALFETGYSEAPSLNCTFHGVLTKNDQAGCPLTGSLPDTQDIFQLLFSVWGVYMLISCGHGGLVCDTHGLIVWTETSIREILNKVTSQKIHICSACTLTVTGKTHFE